MKANTEDSIAIAVQVDAGEDCPDEAKFHELLEELEIGKVKEG